VTSRPTRAPTTDRGRRVNAGGGATRSSAGAAADRGVGTARRRALRGWRRPCVPTAACGRGGGGAPGGAGGRRGGGGGGTGRPGTQSTHRQRAGGAAAQWCLSCVHAQTRNSCKKLRKKLADPPGWRRKGQCGPQQFTQRKSASSGLSTLYHPNRLAALSTAIHSLPSARSPLPCASHIDATSASYGGGPAVERPCRLRRRH